MWRGHSCPRPGATPVYSTLPVHILGAIRLYADKSVRATLSLRWQIANLLLLGWRFWRIAPGLLLLLSAQHLENLLRRLRTRVRLIWILLLDIHVRRLWTLLVRVIGVRVVVGRILFVLGIILGWRWLGLGTGHRRLHRAGLHVRRTLVEGHRMREAVGNGIRILGLIRRGNGRLSFASAGVFGVRTTLVTADGSLSEPTIT